MNKNKLLDLIVSGILILLPIWIIYSTLVTDAEQSIYDIILVIGICIGIFLGGILYLTKSLNN